MNSALIHEWLISAVVLYTAVILSSFNFRTSAEGWGGQWSNSNRAFSSRLLDSKWYLNDGTDHHEVKVLHAIQVLELFLYITSSDLILTRLKHQGLQRCVSLWLPVLLVHSDRVALFLYCHTPIVWYLFKIQWFACSVVLSELYNSSVHLPSSITLCIISGSFYADSHSRLIWDIPWTFHLQGHPSEALYVSSLPSSSWNLIECAFKVSPFTPKPVLSRNLIHIHSSAFTKSGFLSLQSYFLFYRV